MNKFSEDQNKKLTKSLECLTCKKTNIPTEYFSNKSEEEKPPDYTWVYILFIYSPILNLLSKFTVYNYFCSFYLTTI